MVAWRVLRFTRVRVRQFPDETACMFWRAMLETAMGGRCTARRCVARRYVFNAGPVWRAGGRRAELAFDRDPPE